MFYSSKLQYHIRARNFPRNIASAHTQIQFIFIITDSCFEKEKKIANSTILSPVSQDGDGKVAMLNCWDSMPAIRRAYFTVLHWIELLLSYSVVKFVYCLYSSASSGEQLYPSWSICLVLSWRAWVYRFVLRDMISDDVVVKDNVCIWNNLFYFTNKLQIFEVFQDFV